MFSGFQGEFETVAVMQIADGCVVDKNRGLERGALKSFCAIEVDCGGGVRIGRRDGRRLNWRSGWLS